MRLNKVSTHVTLEKMTSLTMLLKTAYFCALKFLVNFCHTEIDRKRFNNNSSPAVP